MERSRISPILLLTIGACILHAQIPASISDPSGDSKKGGPDIVSVSATAGNGIVILRARFVTRHFDPKTTRVVWVLDTDQNAATGSPGLLGAPGAPASHPSDSLDVRRIGTEAVGVVVGACNAGSLIQFDQQSGRWALADQLPAVALSDGFEAYISLDSIGKTDSNINFKAIAYQFSGDCPPKSISPEVNDVAPDVGKPAATVQQADRSNLSAPQPLSPPDGARLNSFPRKTVLQWSAVSGAVGYLVQVQYHDRTSPTGWRPFAFRRVSESTFEFNFVGSQPGRWRVWAIDQSGLVGPSTSWINFDYSPH